ncbi:hypothetical protein [Mucilaginibacter sp. SG564]|uniref:hypothetical protein n=1 Tax=unclassified Mucilaginibacter TaxID=2617802 RepID=UPI001557959B|nr:hypothetical protein [Mucilaginibacter sp. SG564]NOW97766.1 hypothetical protein [Mucilaginibacter sp. SG564]
MTRNHLPTYVIVELLIRLSQHNYLIGDYKYHSVFDTGVMVKTSGGSINFPTQIVLRQFEDPAKISDDELSQMALRFKKA